MGNTSTHQQDKEHRDEQQHDDDQHHAPDSLTEHQDAQHQVNDHETHHDTDHDNAHDSGHDNEHGSGHENPGHYEPKYSGVGFLDLTGVLSVSNVAGVLRSIANEPGEVGELKFEIGAHLRAGTGLVNAKLEGWAELAMKYYISDQNMCNLAIEVEGALEAGIDFAGIIGGGIEFGAGMDFMDKAYRSAEDAARFILMQLAKLNDMADGKLFNLPDYNPVPTAFMDIHETEVFLGANAGAEIGGIEAEVGYQESMVNKDIHTSDHRHYQSSEHHKRLHAELSAEVGPVELALSYERDWSNTVGTPIYYANGIFCDHHLTFGVSSGHLFKKGHMGEAHAAVGKKTRDFVMGSFMALQAAGIGFPHMQALNENLFGHIVEEMTKYKKGATIGPELKFNLIFQWHEYGESDGTSNLMYFRVLVEPELAIGGEVDGKVAGVEAELSASKSEVVYESIGSNTVSYVNRMFIYQTPDRPWSQFVEDNRPEIYQLVENCATDGFLYYVPEVAEAFNAGDGNNYEEGLAALEAYWTSQDHQLQAIKEDMGQFGRHYDEATSFWTWFDSTKREEMGNMFSIVLKYYRDPKILNFFMEQIPAFGMDMDEIMELAEETGYGGMWRRALARAELGGTNQQMPTTGGGGGH